MNQEVEDLRYFFLRVKAAAEEGIARCDALSRPSPAADEDVVYMTMKEYCRHRKVCETTVRKWMELEMPHDRRGSVLRFEVAVSDAWDMQTEVERLAEVDAARGGK